MPSVSDIDKEVQEMLLRMQKGRIFKKLCRQGDKLRDKSVENVNRHDIFEDQDVAALRNIVAGEDSFASKVENIMLKEEVIEMNDAMNTMKTKEKNLTKFHNMRTNKIETAK